MIDEMTVAEFEELARYSARHPPVHLLMAAFVGYKSDEVEPRTRGEPVESLPLPFQVGGIPGVEFGGSLPIGLASTFDPDWFN